MEPAWVCVKIVLVVVFLLSAILMGWLAHVSRKGTLRRNGLAGYRISTTLKSDEAWKAGHQASWVYTAVMSGCSALSCVLALVFNHDWMLVSMAPIMIGFISVLLGARKAGRTASQHQ